MTNWIEGQNAKQVRTRLNLTVWSLFILVICGCSTASSLGLPVASGPYQLLSSAKNIRNKTGHPTDIAHEMAKTVQEAHRVEPGDVLVVEAVDFDSSIRFPSDQTVQGDGTIDLGEYGRVQVAGMTLEQIKHQTESQVANLLNRRNIQRVSHEQRLPSTSLSVRLISNESSLVYVLGEVNAPGSYSIVGRETVLDAIISAGGLTDRANEHRVILTRPATADRPRQIYPICYQQIVQLGDVSTNYQVKPGDRIYVPSLTMVEDLRQSLKWSDRSCPSCREFSK